MTRVALSLSVVVWALAFSSGCVPFRASAPGGFVELNKPDPYDFRATSVEGVVLGVRAVENDPKGDLSFWAKAVENQLRQLGGYAFLGSRPVSCQHGLGGVQLRFGHDEGVKPHLYVVTIFATQGRYAKIFILEAGGTRVLVERNQGAIDEWVARFEPKWLYR